MTSVHTIPTDNSPVPPPTPQEINRKLSVHHRPVKSPPSNANAPVSGTESDSDSFLAPDYPPNPFPTSTHTPYANQINQHAQPQTHVMGFTASASTRPLSSITERRTGSGDEEESEEEEEDGEGDDWIQDQGTNYQRHKIRPASDCVIKSGYLWKKGERRHAWKKRWFVLRPAQLALYKSSKEYKVQRLLDLADIHSCSPVTLKRHANSLVVVSPYRTYYLQAESDAEMRDWVERLNETRQALMSTSTQNSISTPPIPIPSSASGSHHLSGLSQSPTVMPGITPSPPSARSVGFAGPVTSESESEDGAATGATPASYGSMSYSPGAATLVSSPSKSKDPTKPVLSGYLMKCRSKRRGWRKRWFVLTGEKLMYSASHMDTRRQRSIELSEIIDALECDVSHDRHLSGTSSASSPPLNLVASVSPRSGDDAHDVEGAQFTFKIVLTKRSLLLSAPSEEDEIKWMSAVRALIARRTNPPGAAGGPQVGGSNTGLTASTSGVPDLEGTPVNIGTGIKASPSVSSRKRSASGASALVTRDEQQHN